MPGNATLRWTAIAGLLGAAGMYAGDLLLFGHFGSAAEWEAGASRTVAAASTTRLWLAGLAGPIAAIGYAIGVLHIHARLAPAPAALRTLAGLLFVALAVFACAVHAVWGAHALAWRAALLDPALEPARLEVRAYLDLLYLGAKAVGYPASLLLAGLVLAGRSSLPRWTVICNPGLSMTLAGWLVVLVPAPLGALLDSGLFNLSFVLFYAVALATLPRSQD